MKPFLLFVLLLILPQATDAQAFVVSRSKPVTVIYPHNDPDLLSVSPNSKPSNLVDGIQSYSNFLELLCGNEGTRIIIDLIDTVKIDSIQFISQFVDAGIKGCVVRYSVDNVSWNTIDSVRDNTTRILSSIADSGTHARWVELEITQMNPPGEISTILTEVSVWSIYDRPSVFNIRVLPNSTSGLEFQDIEWSSVMWDPDRTVSIFAGSNYAELYVVAQNILNIGSYAWHTEFEPDGPRIVQVIPDTTDRISGVTNTTISNFSQVSIHPEEYIQAPRGGSLPLQYSTPLFDSISIQWTYQWRYAHSHQQEVAFSPDSGKTWSVVNESADTARRTIRLAANSLASGVADGLFRLRILRDGVALMTTTTSTIIQIPGAPPGASFQWGRSNGGNSQHYGGGLLAYRNIAGSSTIIAGSQWLLRANGDAVNGWIWPGETQPFTAAGDLDGNGITEITTLWSNQTRVVPDTSGPHSLYASREGFPGNVRLLDIDGDDTLEILLNYSSSVVVTDQHLKTKISYSGAKGYGDAILLNVAGDDRPELITMTDSISIFNEAGELLPGFPSTFGTAFYHGITPIDATGDGHFEFLLPSSSHLYCFTGSGVNAPGFPFPLPAPMVTLPSIADIDGDGSLDIVFLTGEYYGSFGTIPTTPLLVHCISRTGVELSGWPRQLKAGSFHVMNRYLNGVLYEATKDYFPALASRPLIASIDGDLDLEILITTADGYLVVLNKDGTIRSGYPTFIGTRTRQAGVLGDFDNNGSLNFVYPLYVEFPSLLVVHNIDFGPGTFNPSAIPWPMEMQNSRRTSIPLPAIPVGVADRNDLIPAVFYLSQNYPNPFNPTTTTRYALPQSVHATVRVFNMLGQLVATVVDEVQEAGSHTAQFDGSRLASGMYVVQVFAGSDQAMRKILLLK